MSVNVINIEAANSAKQNDQLSPGEQFATNDKTAALFQDEYANDLFAPGNGDEIRKALGITVGDVNKAYTSLNLPNLGIDNDLQDANDLENDIATLDREEMFDVSLAQSQKFESLKYRAEIADQLLRYKIAAELN